MMNGYSSSAGPTPTPVTTTTATTTTSTTPSSTPAPIATLPTRPPTVFRSPSSPRYAVDFSPYSPAEQDWSNTGEANATTGNEGASTAEHSTLLEGCVPHESNAAKPGTIDWESSIRVDNLADEYTEQLLRHLDQANSTSTSLNLNPVWEGSSSSSSNAAATQQHHHQHHQHPHHHHQQPHQPPPPLPDGVVGEDNNTSRKRTPDAANITHSTDEPAPKRRRASTGRPRAQRAPHGAQKLTKRKSIAGTSAKAPEEVNEEFLACARCQELLAEHRAHFREAHWPEPAIVIGKRWIEQWFRLKFRTEMPSIAVADDEAEAATGEQTETELDCRPESFTRAEFLATEINPFLRSLSMETVRNSDPLYRWFCDEILHLKSERPTARFTLQRVMSEMQVRRTLRGPDVVCSLMADEEPTGVSERLLE